MDKKLTLKEQLLKELNALEDQLHEKDSEIYKKDIQIGDLICYKERYKNGDTKDSYGFIIDEKVGPYTHKLFKIRWLCQTWKDSWHVDPKENPNCRYEYFVISGVKGENNEH
jgi:hypothetical protein